MSNNGTLDELVPDISLLPADLQFLVRYVRFMDAAVRIPVVNVRVGADAVVGLVPVAGDFVGGLMSLYVLAAAIQHGVLGGILFRMALRTAIDFSIGSIPALGDVFDIVYRDKLANVRLLLEHRTR